MMMSGKPKEEALPANGETAPAAEAVKGKKKKGRKRKIVKRIIWTTVILLVLGVTGWSVYSRLRADYKITYEPGALPTGRLLTLLQGAGPIRELTAQPQNVDHLIAAMYREMDL